MWRCVQQATETIRSRMQSCMVTMLVMIMMPCVYVAFPMVMPDRMPDLLSPHIPLDTQNPRLTPRLQARHSPYPRASSPRTPSDGRVP
jgi:hypothetical protein